MNKNVIKIAIASQKGGGGKSTITMIMANKLYFEYGKKVLIIDCDNPQYSNATRRNEELDVLAKITKKIKVGTALTPEEKTWWKLFEKIYRKDPNMKENLVIRPAPVPNQSTDQLANIPGLIPDLENQGFDIIFFDTIGSLSNLSLLRIMEKMDYIFVPIEAENDGLKSAISSLSIFNNILKEKGGEAFGFFNKFRMNENDQHNCMRYVLAATESLNLPLLLKPDTTPYFIEDKSCYRSRLVKSTIIPSFFTKTFEKSEGNKCIEQMCEIVLK